MSTVVAPITPEVLVWVRRQSHRTEEELAHCAGVPLEKYKEWESGISKPTLRQIESIANKVKRPSVVFFMASHPEDPADLPDFRTIRNDARADFNPELALEIRRARYLQSRLVEDISQVVPDWKSNLPSFNLSDNPVLCASEIRKLLGVSISEQKKFKLENRGLREWRNALFEFGVLTYGFRVERSHALGFAIWNSTVPLAGFNLEGFKNQQVFTLFHELAHLCLRQSAVSDLGADRQQVGNDLVRRTEVFCNRFASSFLLPPGQLEVQSLIERIAADEATDASAIDKLAKGFRVSKYVLLHRLLEVGKVPQQQASDVFTKWRSLDEDEDEVKLQKKKAKAEKDKQAGKTIQKSPAAESVNARGEWLARRVLHAFSSGKLHPRDAQDLLDINGQQFVSLERELSRRKVVEP